jgi:hypothetical protein
MIAAPLFSTTAPPDNSLFRGTEYSQSSNEISAFRDSIAASFAALDPKISALGIKLKAAVDSADPYTRSVSNELESALKLCQDQLPAVRSAVNNLGRRVQGLSLANQSAIALEGPKQIRIVRDGFFDLRDQFDESLKNVATLARSLSSKVDTAQTSLHRLRAVSLSAKASAESIGKMRSQVQAGSAAVKSVRGCFSQKIQTTMEKLKGEFEEPLREAEELVGNLDRQASEKLSISSATLSRLENEKVDLRASFESVIGQMQKNVDSRMSAAKNAIAEAERATMEQFEQVQNTLNEELEAAAAEMMGTKKRSMLEEIEYERELAEVERLLSEIERIRKALESSDGKPFDLGLDSDDDEELLGDE